MKEKKKCYQKVRAILKTERNSANRIEAINSLVIPVVTYNFDIVNLTIPEIRRLDTHIRRLVTCNRMHHPKADVNRLYIPRKERGREMINLN